MKKIAIILSLLSVFIYSTVLAVPFLKTDCHDYVEWYDVTIDGTPLAPINAIDGASTDTVCSGVQKRLSYDLEPLGLTDGQHTITVKAVNVWDESIEVPFDFNKGVPATATGIGLSLTP